MKQKRKEKPEFKTHNSQLSALDIFTKVESQFLQKYFRYIITDHFNEHFINVDEELIQKKTKNKYMRQLISRCFLTRTSFLLKDMEHKVNQFFKNKSRVDQDMEVCFRHLYSSSGDYHQSVFEERELVFFDVHVKIDNQKLYKVPLNFVKEIEQAQVSLGECQQYGQAEGKVMRKYGKDYINLVVVYFGDINFNLVDKRHFQNLRIALFKRRYKVRIHVFFISRYSMVESFKTTNKIEQMEYINDLLIQVYEYKREKMKQKRNKKRQGKINQLKYSFFNTINLIELLKWIGVVSGISLTFGLIYKCWVRLASKGA